MGSINAQKIVKVYGDEAYYEVTEDKTVFYYRYNAEKDIIGKIESGGGGLLVPAYTLSADASIEGDYVVLKRIKMKQHTGYRFTITFHNLFSVKRTHKRNGEIKGNLRRWTDQAITMIKQY